MRVFSNLVIIFSFIICSSVEASQLDSYRNQINYNCAVDSDCEVKNIGDCCGYYPKCVNSEANVDPELVSKTCQKEGLVSGCGYQDVDICECISGQCVGDNKKNREFQELIKKNEK
jgi:hypothetical protein